MNTDVVRKTFLWQMRDGRVFEVRLYDDDTCAVYDPEGQMLRSYPDISGARDLSFFLGGVVAEVVV